MFASWTQVEKLQQWAGCKDATKVEIQWDLRAGGSFDKLDELLAVTLGKIFDKERS